MNPNIPAAVEPHLDAIHCASDSKVLLTSSNLTGRYWNGSLWCFQTLEDAPNVEKCVTAIDASAGISDLAALPNNCYALGLDSGGVEVYKLNSDPDSFGWTFGVCEHDDYVTSLSVNSDKSSLVSAGADECIKIWDTNTWSTTATYVPVHDGIIWKVACSLDDSNVFASCGQDGKVLLFDLRLPKPASTVDTITFLNGCPTALCWNPEISSTLVVGDNTGRISIQDMKSSKSVSFLDVHKRWIHNMSFSTNQSMLATCADDTDITVTSLQSAETPVIVYKSDLHDDFVRGLSWTAENDLVSCGWDKKVWKHCKESIFAEVEG